jgi:type IX secretion system substrate protein
MKGVLLFFLAFSFVAHAQDKHNNIWIFGYGSSGNRVILDFTEGQMELLNENFEMGLGLTNTIMSDKDGKLLFYSNGCDINNADHEIMENGEEISPGLMEDIYCAAGYTVWPQGVLALPYPESDSLYYVFNLNMEAGPYPEPNVPIIPYKLYAQLIDMSANNGLGKVIAKNQVVKQDTFGRGGIKATRHANGIDWWLIAPKSHSNCYWMFLIDKDGVHAPALECEGFVWLDRDQVGQQCFSPDGKWYARIHSSNYFQLYRFDNASADLFESINIEIPDLVQTTPGVAFSPNSRYLYANTREKVYQFDLEAEDIPNSRILIAEWDGFVNVSSTKFNMQALAPDNKIYISVTGSTYNLHVINKPDCPGLQCELQQHAIELPVLNNRAIPNLVHYRNMPSGVDCETSNTDTIGKQKEIKVYPNPTNGLINIDYPDSLVQVLVEFYDVTGKLVNRTEITKPKSFDLSNYACGLYFFTIRSNGDILKKGKIIKI